MSNIFKKNIVSLYFYHKFLSFQILNDVQFSNFLMNFFYDMNNVYNISKIRAGVKVQHVSFLQFTSEDSKIYRKCSL